MKECIDISDEKNYFNCSNCDCILDLITYDERFCPREAESTLIDKAGHDVYPRYCPYCGNRIQERKYF